MPTEDGNPYWQEVKAKENAQKGIFDSIASSQPALMRAKKLGEKSAHLGFDHPTLEIIIGKVEEEVAELKTALAEGDMPHANLELGDALFALAQTARYLGWDPELALKAGNEKYARRVLAMVDIAGGVEAFAKLSLGEKNELWGQIKISEKHTS